MARCSHTASSFSLVVRCKRDLCLFPDASGRSGTFRSTGVKAVKLPAASRRATNVPMRSLMNGEMHALGTLKVKMQYFGAEDTTARG